MKPKRMLDLKELSGLIKAIQTITKNDPTTTQTVALQRKVDRFEGENKRRF